MGQDLNGEASSDRFGISVALSANGNILAAGGHWNDNENETLNNKNNAGHVRLYQFNKIVDTWTRLGQDLDGEFADDNFGYSVALSADGSVVASGALFNKGHGEGSGHVRIFEYNGGTDEWEQLGQDLGGENADDTFGGAVALSNDGSVIAVGGDQNDGNGSDSGHIRVYQYNRVTNIWLQLGQDLDGESAGDMFGTSVSLSSDGNVVASGAVWNEDNGGGSGHVRIHKYNQEANTWVQLGQDLDGDDEGDRFGVDVALSADGYVAAAGGWLADGDGTVTAGHVRVFKFAEYN